MTEPDPFESFVRNYVHPSRLGELAGLVARCLLLSNELVPDPRRVAKAEQLLEIAEEPSRTPPASA